MQTNYLQCSEEVQSAIAEGWPVVALESTIIAHGMPYPQNVEAALQVEGVIRKKGVVPATIAILDGKMRAGLTHDEINYLGKTGKQVVKASRRDIAFVLAGKQPGATTVAATMIIADKAGIRIFATGGIGGVHRGAGESMDISADLQEMARTNVGVVSAGVKSILDIGLTLEYLETMGVPVIGYQTRDFPAFYNRESGFPVDYRIESPGEIARILQTKWEAGINGGVLIANPIPATSEPDQQAIRRAIDKALLMAETQRISGKSITPFLLEQVKELTGGKSLEANVALVLNNAELAAEVALKLKSKK